MNPASRKLLTGVLLGLVALTLFALPFALNFVRGGAAGVGYDPRTQGSPMFFAATYPATVGQGPLDGRLVVIVSREKAIEPRLLVRGDSTSAQVFGMDVTGWAPGRAIELTDAVEGFPLPTLAHIRPGYYWVQGLFHRYETVRRAGLPPVQLPAWQQSWVLVSRPVEIYLDPRSDNVIRVDLARTLSVERQRATADQVVRVKSESLSAFWGREVYLEAAVDLPESWSDDSATRYPLILRLSPGPESAAFGSSVSLQPSTQPTAIGFTDSLAASGGAIVATLVHPAPYGWRAFDSDNLGPWGSAVMAELLPEIERRFGGEARPASRTLVGAHADGWQALSLALSHADQLGSVWSVCPGPVDFHDYFGVDLYQDANAFTNASREGEERLQSVLATRSRSGRQSDVWQAQLAPLRDDGYPVAIWDERTGSIDAEIAREVRDRHDVRGKLEREWSALAPKLAGKLHVVVGASEVEDSLSAPARLRAFFRSMGDARFATSVRAGPFSNCVERPAEGTPR